MHPATACVPHAWTQAQGRESADERRVQGVRALSPVGPVLPVGTIIGAFPHALTDLPGAPSGGNRPGTPASFRCDSIGDCNPRVVRETGAECTGGGIPRGIPLPATRIQRAPCVHRHKHPSRRDDPATARGKSLAGSECCKRADGQSHQGQGRQCEQCKPDLDLVDQCLEQAVCNTQHYIGPGQKQVESTALTQ